MEELKELITKEGLKVNGIGILVKKFDELIEIEKDNENNNFKLKEKMDNVLKKLDELAEIIKPKTT